MPYPLSATRLQTYHRCPQSYYFRYERRVPAAKTFGGPALGKALHKALAQIYGEWDYADPKPDWDWFLLCWKSNCDGLNAAQFTEGQAILRRYFDAFIVPCVTMHRPLGIEGRIQGYFQTDNVEFSLTGRYDRLDWLAEDGLELIDYKSNKDMAQREPVETDLQLGLYYLALEQQYGKSLRKLSLIYLRTGQVVSYEVTPDHGDRVKATISEMALRLRRDEDWPTQPGHQCDRCTYTRYCDAVCETPEPLPQAARAEIQLQLSLSL
jgi:putative RecB family exonuclease